MKHLARALVLAAALSLGAVVVRQAAAADPLVLHDQSVYETRAMVSMACSKCHGFNGVSISPLFPILAAQQASYIEWQLQNFRLRGRSDPHARAFMWGIARALNDTQIEALAQYFASQPRSSLRPTRHAELAARGKSIYENGVPERGILGCIGCHGPGAEGIHTFPRLAGQHHDYLVIQLQQFTGQLRESEIMHRFTQDISQEEIDAVAEYLSSL